MITVMLILKEWKLVLIGILLALLISLGSYTQTLRVDKVNLKNQYKDYVHVVEQTNLRNKVAQAEIDLATSQQLQRIEVQHNEQIKKLYNDLASANNATRSLSEQLTIATTRIKEADADQVRAYSLVVTDTLKECSARYTNMAAKADEHQFNAAKVTDQHNTLVDHLNNPDNNNK